MLQTLKPVTRRSPLVSGLPPVRQSTRRAPMVPVVQSRRHELLSGGRAFLISRPRYVAPVVVVTRLPRMVTITRRAERPFEGRISFFGPTLRGSATPPPDPGAYIRYTVTFTCDTVFPVGANGPFIATITRPDGELVDPPSSKPFRFLDFSTGVELAEVEGELIGDGEPALIQTVACHYTMARRVYKLIFLPTIGDDTFGGELMVVCNQ